MNLGNLTSKTTCYFCGFDVWISPYQESAVCDHCKHVIDLNFANILINKSEGENEMKKSTITMDITQTELKTVERLKPDYIAHVKELIQEELNKPLDVKVKYHDSNMPKLEKIKKGNWVDCRVAEGGKITFDIGTDYERKESLNWEDKVKADGTKTKVLKYHKGDFMMLCLGISLNQGEGYEVNLVPRSSTFKNYHIIQTNHFGVGDDTFVGNGDIYHFPCYALADGEIELYDRVCQMKINKAMSDINFNEVNDMEAEDRNGFGSTGVK